MISDASQQFPWLPNLSDYEVTSKATQEYNCFAWALGDTSNWYDPRSDLGYYWPLEATHELVIRTFIELFRSAGYEVCSDGSLEPEYEKVAIYALDAEGTHAARQLENGRWTSKLGSLEDIEHATSEEVNCDLYGKVEVFMRRQKQDQKA